MLCLLLAAGSALASKSPPAAENPPTRSGVSTGLSAGQVAVPVPVDGSVPYVHPGDHIGVLASSDTSASSWTGSAAAASDALLVVDRLRVLSVETPDSGLAAGGTTVVLVAADRAEAVQLARYVTRSLFLIVDRLP